MIYAKEVSSKDSRFGDRSIKISSPQKDGLHLTKIVLPDNKVICNGCNSNIYPETGYLVYLGKRELKNDQPYDLYCKECLPSGVL